MRLKENANNRVCECVIRVPRYESEFFSSRNNFQKYESEIYLRELCARFICAVVFRREIYKRILRIVLCAIHLSSVNIQCRYSILDLTEEMFYFLSRSNKIVINEKSL